MTDVIGHVAAWLKKDMPAEEPVWHVPAETDTPPPTWTPDRLARVKNWLDEVMQPIVRAACATAEGDSTATFDEYGWEGKLVTQEEGERVRLMIIEHATAVIAEAGLVGRIECINVASHTPRLPGHSIFRTVLEIVANSPVPPEFR